MFVIFTCSCQTPVEEPNCRYFCITLLWPLLPNSWQLSLFVWCHQTTTYINNNINCHSRLLQSHQCICGKFLTSHLLITSVSDLSLLWEVPTSDSKMAAVTVALSEWRTNKLLLHRFLQQLQRFSCPQLLQWHWRTAIPWRIVVQGISFASQCCPCNHILWRQFNFNSISYVWDKLNSKPLPMSQCFQSLSKQLQWFPRTNISYLR